MEPPREISAAEKDSYFPSTCWSLLQPGSAANARAQESALETLAQSYAEPIRAFLQRALGRDAAAAEELAQEFFLWMMESGFLTKADPARGRFRAFLKTALRHYVQDADRKVRAQKRGGLLGLASLNAAGERDGAPLELSDPKGQGPERALDDAWRAEVIEAALAQVEERLAGDGRGRVFEVFRAYFLDPAPDVDYRALAERFSIKTTDVSNDLVRAKQLFRQALEQRVRETVSSPLDLREELAWLLGGTP